MLWNSFVIASTLLLWFLFIVFAGATNNIVKEMLVATTIALKKEKFIQLFVVSLLTFIFLVLGIYGLQAVIAIFR